MKSFRQAMLEGPTRIQRLDLEIDSNTSSLAKCISYHTSSLTQLTIKGASLNVSVMPSLLEILGSCGKLQDMSINKVEHGIMDQLLNKDNWKNPDALGKLEVANMITMRFHGQWLRTGFIVLLSKSSKPPSASSVEYIKGWRVPRAGGGLVRGRRFLEAFLKAVQRTPPSSNHQYRRCRL